MKKTFLLLTAGLAMTSLSYAGSFQLNLQGIRQTAMGGSGVAMPWDAAVMFYNPGALSRISGFQAYGSVYFVSPEVRYLPTNGGLTSYESQKQTSTPFAAYVGGTLRKIPKLGLGIGMYTPFGSSINWGDDWTGRYVTQSISLKSFFVQPTISYAITDWLSVGAGFVYGFGSVNIQRALPVQFNDGSSGQVILDGKARGYGFNAGIHIKATDELNFGISYRSGVDMKVDNGTATFTVPAVLGANFPSGTAFKTQLPLPDILTVGASYKISDEVTLQGDLVWAGWKRYDSLKFDFAQTTAAVTNSREPRLYQNTLAVRLGAHAQVSKHVAIMGGGAWDPTPSNGKYVSPDAVDADRLSLSAGITVTPVRNLDIMALVNYTSTIGRPVEYRPAGMSGEYQIKSLVPAVGLSYKF
ncbi:MAG: long-chain fatty acid transporter [Sphingobacteriales bacterium]|nr:MAG: long-chain fatty acid transporter [Sphingobacteriales bacterium]